MALAFGLFSLNSGPCSYPETAGKIARAAEDAGFDSLWCGEHVVLPDPQAPPSPMAPLDRILDPVVALTWCAAHTKRVKLGTGIIILPQRNPLVLAKELASLDVLSGGRLIFGVGVGYLEPEFRALGAPFEDRGKVTDEYMAAMRTIWSERAPAFAGRFVSYSKIQAHPQPVQQPTPPIVIGGRSAPAFRRAVSEGHGWYGFGLDPDGAAQCVEGLKRAAGEVSRPAHLGKLEISVTPRRGAVPDRAAVERYAALGIDRLVLLPRATLDAAGLESFVADAQRELIGRF